MRRGSLYIDGKDAFDEFGAFVEEGGYKALFQMPAFKKTDFNEWHEYDGAEYDLSAPVIDNRSISLPLCIVDIGLFGDLLTLLSDGSLHSFNFAEIALIMELRLSSNNSIKTLKRLGKITLSFIQDKPIAPLFAKYDYSGLLIKDQGYQIDGIDFGKMGVCVLEGTDESIIKAPNVRENLSRSSGTKAGTDYDNSEVRFKTKDVTMKLLILGDDIAQFKERWAMLFALLLQEGERTLYIDKFIEEYSCFYKSCTISKFKILGHNRHVWCEFSLVLTLTDCRPAKTDILLASEDSALITTEDGAYITLNPI